MTIVHEHVGCKENCKNFTVALKMLDVFKMKQMYDSLITRKEILPKIGIYDIDL